MVRAMEWSAALAVAEAAAREAGDVLRRDLHRAEGPRGGGDKAEADVEAERAIRARLTAAFPGWGYRGEETGAAAGRPGAPIWLVDPNDGTRDYLRGRRGSSVSIGLLAEGRPVLGVVFAFAYPDDAGDMFAWAEGMAAPVRNGVAVRPALPGALGAEDVVLVSGKGDRDPEGNLRCARPARYRSVPSIAHRLALVACGEAAAATSFFAPGDWDYAGGHALLRAVGGALLDEEGRPVAYAADGSSRCRRAFGSSPSVAALLAGRAECGAGRASLPRGAAPARLARGRAVADAPLLARAQGCLLGQVAGDSLGSLVESATAEDVAARHPEGPRRLADGGVWRTIAGQPTDDSEMALALARAVVAEGGYRAEAALAAYRAWADSGPFDMGRATRAALLAGAPMADSQANGSLMRASPLGVLGHALAPREAAALARADAALTHPHPVCGDATAAFVVALAHAVRHGDGGAAAWGAARDWAEAQAQGPVRDALRAAEHAPPPPGAPAGWVLVALQNAFFELLHAETLEEGVVRTVRRGGDADTNACIAGALLGAVHGRQAVPLQWRSMVLSCRPWPGFAPHPRPVEYWPVDVLELAERLLLAGGAG
jgi:ADP-ribosylglycohydrolase/fructose-1,6-bisphosphatase/inositol monophosphatase family enzyme